MGRIVRYAAIAVAVLLVVAVVGLAIFAATFDANRYKPEIAAVVKERTGRTLEMPGDIHLSVFPQLGVVLGPVTLSERNRDEEFASIQSARVAVAAWPLLRQQVVVDELALRGLRASLVRHKDGSTNIDDLIAPPKDKPAAAPGGEPAPAQPVTIDIDEITISDANLTWRDEATGQELGLANLNLKTGRIANDVPSSVALTTRVTGKQPEVSLETKFRGRLTFNLEAHRYAVQDLLLEAAGKAGEWSDITASANGNVAARLESGEFSAERLKLQAVGQRGEQRMDLAADVPKLVLSGERYSGERATATVRLINGQGTIAADIALAGVSGDAKAFKTGALTLKVEGRQGERSIKADASAPVAGSLEARRFRIEPLALAFTFSGPNIPGGKVAGEFKGEADVDAKAETAKVSLGGTLAESPLTATAAVRNFGKPAITFDVDVETLDVDRLAAAGGAADKPKARPAADKGAPAAAAAADTPLDFSALEGLNLDGTVKIGSLKAANVRASDVRLGVKASGGKLQLTPQASLYDGKLAGTVALAATTPPSVSVRNELTGVQVGPLLTDAGVTDRLEGRGRVRVDLAGAAPSVDALKKALAGTASFALHDGAIKGINLEKTIRQVKAVSRQLRGKEPPPPTESGDRTDFTELTGTFHLKDGIARNDDLAGKSPLLRLAGDGTVDIVANTLDYRLKATVVGTAKGQGGKDVDALKGVTVPVQISGPLAQPMYTVDVGAVAGDAATQALQKELEKRLGGGQSGGTEGAKPSPLDALKGIFRK
ncbi:MAG TPA: AsmA family protein [Pelomicrobium sp.]|nr:AsmA family protein [Pelomicrobium sp.]